MKTALILIDIQNDYFKNGRMELFEPEKAEENAKLILEEFRNRKLPIIHVQHISTIPGSYFFMPNTHGVEIHEGVKPINGEKIITKHFPNSFIGTELLDYLKQLDVNKLIIVGMMTHMCVDATARAAKELNFECVVIGDACATKNLDINYHIVTAAEVQKSTLEALNKSFSTVLTAKEFLIEQ